MSDAVLVQERELTPSQAYRYCVAEIQRMDGLLYVTPKMEPAPFRHYEYVPTPKEKRIKRRFPKHWRRAAMTYRKALKAMLPDLKAKAGK